MVILQMIVFALKPLFFFFCFWSFYHDAWTLMLPVSRRALGADGAAQTCPVGFYNNDIPLLPYCDGINP